jgi:N-methylhydantoinase A
MGRDPHDFALLAYGGAGGLVAVDIARELGIPTVIIPPGSGAFSALGMLMADIQYDYARTELRPLAALDAARVTEIFEPMEAEAAEVLNGEGFGVDKQVFTRSVDVRYSGQEHSVTVIIPSDTADVASAVERTFADLHERQYGHTMDDPIEMTTLRLRAIGLVDKPVLPMMAIRGEIELRSEGAREIYLSDQQPSVPYDLYSRESLFAGDEIAGPAVISEHTATIVVHRGDHVRVGDHGEIVIDVDIQRKV